MMKDYSNHHLKAKTKKKSPNLKRAKPSKRTS